MKQQNEIQIDEKTQENIQDIVRTINELQGRLQLIMQTVLNCANIEGNYKLSDDLTKLVRLDGDEK